MGLLSVNLYFMIINNYAKCPNCEATIANIHYESHEPDASSGYKGSKSFTAVAFPCGHAISAVPETWEMRLDEIEKIVRDLNQKVDYLYREIGQLSEIIRNNNLKIK